MGWKVIFVYRKSIDSVGVYVNDVGIYINADEVYKNAVGVYRICRGRRDFLCKDIYFFFLTPKRKR